MNYLLLKFAEVSLSASGSYKSRSISPKLSVSAGTTRQQSMHRPTQAAGDVSIEKSMVNADIQKIKKDWTVVKPRQQLVSSRTRSDRASNMVDKRFNNQKRTAGSRGMSMI